MSLDEIDAQLADWKTRIQLVSDNVMALRESDSYRRLRGEGGWPKVAFTGETAARTAPALAAFQAVWAHYALLTDAIERAAALRATVSWLMPSRTVLTEIERLLTGPSIVLPPTVTPLADRGLLTAPEVTEAVSPQCLLDAMARSFETARDAVVAVGTAWTRTTAALAALDAEVPAVADLAAAVNEEIPVEVGVARRTVAEVQALANTDPLAAGAAADEVTALLRTARARLEQAAEARDRVRADLAAARPLWRTIHEAHTRAAAAVAERDRKVLAEGECPAATDEDQFRSLEPWLDRLDATFRKGGWKAVRVGLANWTRTATACRARDEAAFAASDALLRERENLRGLLGALKAKAAVTGRAEDPETSALAGEAERLLQGRPTPMPRARELVRKYQARLL